MNALRWVLSWVTILVMVGFIALLVLADNVRRSFGASENGPLATIVPVSAMLVLILGLLLPGQRVLVHIAAATALGLGAWAVQTLRESLFIGIIGLAYSALYLIWYWQSAWIRPHASNP